LRICPGVVSRRPSKQHLLPQQTATTAATTAAAFTFSFFFFSIEETDLTAFAHSLQLLMIAFRCLCAFVRCCSPLLVC
jgi:hypothetical protein